MTHVAAMAEDEQKMESTASESPRGVLLNLSLMLSENARKLERMARKKRT